MKNLFFLTAVFLMIFGFRINAYADDRSQRFILIKEENGFLRLDSQTGATSFCKTIFQQVVCKPSIEHSGVNGISGLSEKVGELE